jgi:hypothetical protein
LKIIEIMKWSQGPLVSVRHHLTGHTGHLLACVTPQTLMRW